MDNIKRERVEFAYELTARQHEKLLSLALRQNRSIEELLLEAVDRYLEGAPCSQK